MSGTSLGIVQPLPTRRAASRPVLTLVRPPLSAGEADAPAAHLSAEDLVLCQSSLAAVRLAAHALLASGAREAVLEELDRRGLRAALLTDASSADAAPPAPDAHDARWAHVSLAEFRRASSPLCDVLLVDGYEQLALSLPAVHVRAAKPGELCATYEVHAADVPPRLSVRRDGDLSRHARELADWRLATAA